MGNGTGKEELVGFLRDSGVSAMIAGRIASLIDAFGGNVQQFVAATHAQLGAAYNKTHPDTGSSKGLGKSTYEAFDMLVKRYKSAQYSAKQVAAETVAAQEAERARKEAERRGALSEILETEISFDSMTTAMASHEILGRKSSKLGELLGAYRMAEETKKRNASGKI